MQTATNPQTGEKLVLQGGQWVPAGSAAPSGGPVYGPPPAAPKPAGPPSGYREGPNGSLEIIPGGPADPMRPGGEYDPNKPAGAGDKGTDAQRANAAYADRAFRSLKVYGGAGLGPRSLVGEGIAKLPGGVAALGYLPDAVGDSPERQNSEQAKRDFATIILRSDSGANAPEQEVERLVGTFFPGPGETDPRVIENYHQARIAALNGVRSKAGLPPLSPEEVEQLKFMGDAPAAGEPALPPVLNEKGQPLLEVDVVGGRMPQDVQAEIDQRVNQTDQFGSGLRGAADTITFGMADEAAAGLSAFTGALGGQGSLVDLYNRNIGVERGYADALQQRDPGTYFTGQLLGGVALPIGAGAQGASQLARIGAVQGGLYGYGSSEGNPLQRIPGAAAGAGIGAAGGAALGGLSGLIRNRGTGAAAQEVMDNRAVIEAGQRQGIPIRQPDARPSTRADFAAAEASETGNRIITPALRSDAQAVESKLVETGGQGRALDDYEMGQRVQAAGDKYLVRTRGQANALYSRAEQMAGNAQGQATRAIQAIDQEIADLSSTGANTNAGAIKYLTDLKADLQGGASIAKLRNIRSNVRGQINERNLTSTDTERRVGNVLNALSDDVNSILPQNARGAFANADKFYRERMEFKDQVIRRFVGAKNDPISPETAAARFQSFMKSKDFGRFSRMMDELEPGDRADIAATVAEHLGRGRNGEFSLAALSTNVSNMSGKALEKVFGAKGAQAIQDLKIIARAKADTAGALNSSRTGVVNQRMGLKDAMFGIFGGSVAGIPGAISGMAFRNISEKVGNRRLANALLDPSFSKWLKNVPNNPAAAKPYIGLLNNVAAKSAAGADIKAIQSALLEAFAQSPARAAAQQEDNGGNVPPQ